MSHARLHQRAPEAKLSSYTFNMKIKDFHQTVRDAAASCTFLSRTVPDTSYVMHVSITCFKKRRFCRHQIPASSLKSVGVTVIICATNLCIISLLYTFLYIMRHLVCHKVPVKSANMTRKYQYDYVDLRIRYNQFILPIKT